MLNLQTTFSWRRSHKTDQYHLFDELADGSLSKCGHITIEDSEIDKAHHHLTPRKAREKAASVGEMYCGGCVMHLFYKSMD